MSKSSTLRAFATAAFVAGVSLATAQAAERETQSVTVEYADLNLASKEGIATLRDRLMIASRHVCGVAGDVDLSVMADMAACRDTARQAALRQLDRVVASATWSRGSTVLAANAN